MTRTVDDVFDIMRRGLSKRNTNDPTADFSTFIRYLNDFVSIYMGNDVKFIEQYGTLEFTISTTPSDGVYTFNDVGATSDFVNISMTAFCNNNYLIVYQNPAQFYGKWNQFDTSELTAGQPTDMLYYGNEFVFRTIPDQDYTVRIFGYKQMEQFNESDVTNGGNQELPFDYYVRFFAYGAMLDYALDFNYDETRIAKITKGFQKYKKNLFTRTHNQIKYNTGVERF